MRVLVTGSKGFIGKNLLQHLDERSDVEVAVFTKDMGHYQLRQLLEGVSFIFHLAGVNRSQNESEFTEGNNELTCLLCKAIADTGRPIPVIYASSIQAKQENPYGLSKRLAEDALFNLERLNRVPVHIFRLPNVFGKWSKPNYNSVVATFCYNVSRNLAISIDDSSTMLKLVYVDDLVDRFIKLMDGADTWQDPDGFEMLSPEYTATVGELARQIQAFKNNRSTLMADHVGIGLARALYATYISFLPVEEFSYPLPMYRDVRGVFVEMLKTPDCGQFSFFTALPGITRGGHYHHTKTEKFLVIRGQALFKFRHILTNEIIELTTSGSKAEVVETVPGWTHDITNIGGDELMVMLWANEVFNTERPDTYAKPI